MTLRDQRTVCNLVIFCYLLTKTIKLAITLKKWLDLMLPMTSYLVALATDSHHTLKKKCQATENSRCLKKIVLKKIGNNFWRTGIHNLPFVHPTPVKTEKQIQISIRSLRAKMNQQEIPFDSYRNLTQGITCMYVMPK